MLRDVEWYNDAVLEEVQSWEEHAQKVLGHQLRDVQNGEFPETAKWLSSVGRGVLQLKERSGHRMIIALEIGADIWVLHAFKNDAANGNRTRKRHMDLAEQRANELMAKYGVKH